MYKTETGELLEFLWDIDKANYFWLEYFLLEEVQGWHTGALKVDTINFIVNSFLSNALLGLTPIPCFSTLFFDSLLGGCLFMMTLSEWPNSVHLSNSCLREKS